ncbi:uncharacterized protein LOC113514746 [Galleria mellonella]|uniref:Nucleoporin NUP42 n=1 Tax=Galleria mellonella TaxID=7137 RepID=A0A6J1WR48_GALME|nr:uncharacterized protein LOC113514746 [Galleria mellonella]
MVVCKYFQQGYCRYGQNCRFEHVYGSKYSYHANTPASQSTSGVTDEQLVNQVQSDVQAALKGSQWLLSSYAPFKEKPVFPGILDLSPEEARLLIYEAKANNTLGQAISYMNNLYKETRQKYEQLLQPTSAITKVLRSIYKGEAVTSPFANTTSGLNANNPNAASVFRSAVQNNSAFGTNSTVTNNTPSIFGQQSNSIFSQSPDNSAAKSIFAQANQNVFGSSQTIFGQNPPTNNFGQSPSNTFGQNQIANNQATSNIFGSPPSDNAAAKSIFAQANQNIFSSNQTAQTPHNVFGSASQSVFGSQPSSLQQNQNVFATQANVFQEVKPSVGNVFEQPAHDTGVYSMMDDISPEDMEDFKSDEFKLGLIPEVPPPKGLCF